MRKAIDIIEHARSYYLLSNDHAITKSKPVYVGGRIKLTIALADIDADMIIATSGNDKRCIVLVDFSTDDVWNLAQRADKNLLKIKAIN